MRWAVDAVWDIETSQWDQFLCGVLWTARDGIQRFRSPDDLANALMRLPRGAQAWAHSGGKFDVLWLLDHLTRVRGDKVDAIVSMSGASATSVKFKGGPWLRDSARLLPMSLARAAPIAGRGRKKGDAGIPFEKIHHGMSEEYWRSVIEYCVSDVELLRDVLFTIAAYAEAQGIELRGTIGGTAWATAVKWCGVDEADWRSRDYDYVREAYYGGLCGVGKTRAPRIWRYDRKSAYPASLTLPVPVGDSESLDSDGASRALASGVAGAYRVRVRVPESHAPPLPFRHRERLTYPYGSFEGTWPQLELAHAIECGAVIEKVKSAIVWHEEAPIFEPYSRKCFALRDELGEEEKKALGVWLKFLANSLTGKLGQSPDFRIVVIGDYADDARYDLVGTSPWVWSRESWRIPQCALVHMAMTLTARARVELHSEILHAGDDWAYSDTDSCIATRELTRAIGTELGDFAFEGEGEEWSCEAPKVYAYRDMEKMKDWHAPKVDPWVSHAKGVPIESGDMDAYRSYARGEPIENNRGVKSLLVAARGEKLFERRQLTRRLKKKSEWVGARLRASRGETRAPHVTALARL